MLQSAGGALTASGRGIRDVIIHLTDESGNTRTMRTSMFGYYRFKDVAGGETYIITAEGKRFIFSEQTRVLNTNNDLTEVDFIANSAGNSKELK
jgi:hypothetical protein